MVFADAREVAETLIAGIPVLLDLTSAETEVAKRVLDFSTGVVFGLASSMHRVDRNVFLLTPAGTEVTRADGGDGGSRGRERSPGAAGVRGAGRPFVGRSFGRNGSPGSGALPSGYDRAPRAAPGPLVAPGPTRPRRGSSGAPARHRTAAVRLRRAPRAPASRSARSPCSPGPAAAASPARCGRTRRWPDWAAAPRSTRCSRIRLACVPERARPDAQRRRGFRIGCTADGPEGPVRLDVAVQAEPDAAHRGRAADAAGGVVLLETALRDPGRRHGPGGLAHGGPVPGHPRPAARRPARHRPAAAARRGQDRRAAPGARRRRTDGGRPALGLRLRPAARPDARPRPRRCRDGCCGGCGNLADVLWRTRAECATRHAQLVAAVRAGCAGPVADVLAERARRRDGAGAARPGRRQPATDCGRLGDGELRYLALALVLLTGPGRAGGGPRRRGAGRPCRRSPCSPTASTGAWTAGRRANCCGSPRGCATAGTSGWSAR